jgi:Carboxypeptidase regulatory-like domain
MKRIVLVLVATLAGSAPTAAWAQAVVTGRVREVGGEPIEGAVVEIISPALIEKSREARSDAHGRYRIEGLRPGFYTIRALVQGLTPRCVTENVELSGTRTLTFVITLAVPTADEVILPNCDRPYIDVQSATRQLAIDDSLIRAIPNRRNYNSLLVLVPGVTTDRNDIVVDPLMASFPIHGGRPNDGRLLVDGMSVGSTPNGGQPAHYLADVANSEEVVFTTSAGLGEAETSGLVMNVVPKQGGNKLSSLLFFSGNGESMQGSNITPQLRDIGIVQSPKVSEALDFGAAAGGPIARDRVWYFVSGRRQSLTRAIPGLYYNVNAGNQAAWSYQQDFSRPAYSDRTWAAVGGRMTVLATPKNRFSVFHDEQAICRSCTGATSITGFPDTTMSPEAQGVGDISPQRFDQLTWQSPAADRLLLEAGYARSAYRWGNSERTENDRSLVRAVQITGFASPTSFYYRSQDWSDNRTALQTWHASAAWWAGAHSFKVGYQGLFGSDDRTFHSNDQSVTYRFNNGELDAIIEVLSPYPVFARVSQGSAFVQDLWTRARVTLHGALRYDRVHSWFPEQRIGPSRFLPAGLVFPKTDGVNAYRDLTPRGGIAYDVFGNSRTALKVSAGKYLEGAGTTGIYYDSNPATSVVRTTSRGWFDADQNLVPGCDLVDPSLTRECGPPTDVFLSQPPPFWASSATFFSRQLPVSFDPSVLNGSGVRPSDWNVGVSVEQQLAPRLSMEVGYYRRWFDGFTVADNVLAGPAHFQQRTATAPRNESLPNGGGQMIGPLYIQTLSLLQQVTTRAEKYGDQYRRSDSFDVTVNGRTPFGLSVLAGSSTTQTVSDSCQIRAAVPESAPLNPYCHVSTGARTQFRGLATYTIPRVDVQVGAVYLNKPGPEIVANASLLVLKVFDFTRGQFTSVVVNLVEPGTLYGDRIRQLDLRAAKILRLGRVQAVVGIDLYNALNSSDVLTYSDQYSSSSPLGRPVMPTSILSPRLARISADVSF